MLWQCCACCGGGYHLRHHDGPPHRVIVVRPTPMPRLPRPPPSGLRHLPGHHDVPAAAGGRRPRPPHVHPQPRAVGGCASCGCGLCDGCMAVELAGAAEGNSQDTGCFSWPVRPVRPIAGTSQPAFSYPHPFLFRPPHPTPVQWPFWRTWDWCPRRRQQRWTGSWPRALERCPDQCCAACHTLPHAMVLNSTVPHAMQCHMPVHAMPHATLCQHIPAL